MFRLRPSLDFNLIENILSIIKRKLFDKIFFNEETLWEAIKNE